MAVRVNSKFIVILLTASVAAVGVIGGLWYLQVRGDASRNIRAGDEYMARGEMDLAAQYYGRAVNKQPANLVYLEKMREALRQTRPETASAAGVAYETWLGTLSHEAHYHSHDPEAHLRLLREIHGGVRLIALVSPGGAPQQAWERVAIAAQNMLDYLPETEPKRVYGKLYRGMARIRQHAYVSEEVLDNAERDLHEFVEAMPKDDFGWATLVRNKSLLAEHWRLVGHARRAEQKDREIAEIIEAAAEHVPDGIEVMACRAIHLASIHLDGGDVTVEQVHAAAVRAAELALDTDDPWLLIEVAQIIQLLAVPAARERAIGIYNAYLERHPEALAHRFFKAKLQQINGEIDAARATAEEVIKSPPLPVSFVSRTQLGLRRLAASLIVDIEYQRWSQAEEAQRPTIRAAIVQAREQLGQLGADPTTDQDLIRADGKVALASEDYETAAAKFEQLIRLGAKDTETLANASVSLERTGQIGLAHERIIAAIENKRAPAWLLSRKAWLEYSMGRFDEAARSMSEYLRRVPNDEGVLDLAQAIRARLMGDEAELDPVFAALQRADRAVQAGDNETALATLYAAMESRIEAGDGDDVRLLTATARIEMLDGRTEAAAPLVERALMLQPDDSRLRRLKTILETGDVVAAARQFIEGTPDIDPVDRAVHLVVSLNAIAVQHRLRSEELDRSGDAPGAAKARDIAERASAELSSEVVRVREIPGAVNHSQFIDYEFTRALEAQDWSRAEQFVHRAREHDADQVEGLIFRGRYEFERRRFEQAARAFQQATDLKPFNSMGWRGLALSYTRLGNYREAQRAFEQAYRVNPNDITMVRQYLGLLMQMQEKVRAAQIVRNAHRLMPHDVQLRELWLDIEHELGNLVMVFNERLKIRERSPRDRRNLLRLAMLYGSAEPTYELILNPDGTRTFTERRWQQMGVSEQRRHLQQLQDRWRAEADVIVKDLASREGTSLEIIAVQATLLRLRNETVAGERLLQDYIASHADSPRVAQMYILLSQYQNETGNPVTALASLREAVKRQGQTSQGDVAISDFYFTRGRYEEAAQHLERALTVEPSRQLMVRAAECYSQLRQFDKAEAQVAAVLADGEMDYIVAMLQAMIAHGQGEELLAAGRTAEADRKFEAHRDALATAERLMPTDPTPHVLRARSLLMQFHRTQQRQLLDDAIRVLEQADVVRPGDVATTLTRVDVQRAMGVDRAAVAELSRALQRAPENVQVRQRLAQLYVEMGDRTAAIATISQAIEMFPNSPLWHELRGNLHAMGNSDLAAAAVSYKRAYELSRLPNLLGRYVSVLLASSTPDYATAESVLRREAETVQAEPEFGALYGMILVKTGRSEAGLQEMRRSYRQLQDMIAASTRVPADFNGWFRALNPLFSEQSPAVVEQAIRDMSEQKPSVVELAWLANYWGARGGAGMSRALELTREAQALLQPDDRDMAILLNLELGRYHIMTEQYGAAVAAFRKVLEAAPDHVVALNNLAFVMSENLDQPREALAHARRAADLAPQSAHILDTLGSVHYRLGEHGKAREILLRSLELDETAVTQFHLARVLIAEGDVEGAKLRLDRAAQLQPDQRTQAEISRLVDDIRTGGGQLR